MPHEPPEHNSEHVKSQNFFGSMPPDPLPQSIVWAPLFVFALGPPNPLGGPACQSAVKTVPSCAECGEGGKWALCIAIHSVCPCSTHTNFKDCNVEWPTLQTLYMPLLLEKTQVFFLNHGTGQQLSQYTQHHILCMEPQYSNNCQQFVLTSNRFWFGPQASQPFVYPFVYQPTCTTL